VGVLPHSSFACLVANAALITSNQKRKTKPTGRDVGLSIVFLWIYDK